MKIKIILIILILIIPTWACKKKNFMEKFYIPEHQKFILKQNAQLIFQNEQSVNDTLVIDNIIYSTIKNSEMHTITETEEVYFKKPNSMLTFPYYFKKYGKAYGDGKICFSEIFFNNDSVTNDEQDPNNSIFINYDINGKNYPYVDYILTNNNNKIFEIYFNPQYGIIKYCLQDNKVWSLYKIIE